MGSGWTSKDSRWDQRCLSRRSRLRGIPVRRNPRPKECRCIHRNTSEPEIQEIGGEPLEGSGFETEDPATEFESDERLRRRASTNELRANNRVHATPTKRDHRQEVTDSIVKMLEDGVAPWQKPWESAGMPFNPTTDKAYRGGNAVHLMATGLSQGYEDPRWMTYKQAAENGWQVRKGEKGTHIEFWEVKAKPEERNGEPSKKRRRRIHQGESAPPHSSGLHGLQRQADRGRTRLRAPSNRSAFEAVQVASAYSPTPARKSRTTSATARSIVRPQTASTCLRRKPSKTRLAITALRFTNSHTGPATPRG